MIFPICVFSMAHFPRILTFFANESLQSQESGSTKRRFNRTASSKAAVSSKNWPGPTGRLANTKKNRKVNLNILKPLGFGCLSSLFGKYVQKISTMCSTMFNLYFFSMEQVKLTFFFPRGKRKHPCSKSCSALVCACKQGNLGFTMQPFQHNITQRWYTSSVVSWALPSSTPGGSGVFSCEMRFTNEYLLRWKLWKLACHKWFFDGTMEILQ